MAPKRDVVVSESAQDIRTRRPRHQLGDGDDPRVEKLAKRVTSVEVRQFIEDEYERSVLPVTSG
ncbi:ABC-type metal ion transport system substrate-binding protein [Streptomyces umbrinus]|uniref:ABC-type metal ion transport system substrate-binding protein n=1 Tax=Streptomyces umbrinus TaxID=67370 RepID=A0ABU0T4M4_9ACTN|nr:ABC-type metal ion transport system substrate-binding protein [Streptomyces umbrinus]